MVHRCEHLCSASQLWLPHLALCVVLPECFWGLRIWSGAVGSKSGKLQNVADCDNNPQLCHDLVHVHHSAIVAGHPGCWKMLELMSQNYWWPGLSRYITKFIAGCDV